MHLCHYRIYYRAMPGKIARTQRRVALTTDHDIAMQRAVAVNPSHSHYPGSKGVVLAKQLERSSRSHRLHRRGSNARLIGSVGSHHRARVNARHAHTHRAIAQRRVERKAIDSRLHRRVGLHIASSTIGSRYSCRHHYCTKLKCRHTHYIIM